MVEVILPRPRASFASTFRPGRESRRRVPTSLLVSPRPNGEGHFQASIPQADSVGLTAAEVTAATREQRRLEMERELCEKLGLQTPEASPVAAPKLPIKAPSVRPTSAGPSRPPKPKPHRPLPEAAGNFQAPVSAEDLPSVRRWKSSALSDPLPSPDRSSERPELSKTAPAALGDEASEDKSSPAMSPRQGHSNLLRGTGLCIAVNIKQQPSAPLSLEASPASGAAEVSQEADAPAEEEAVPIVTSEVDVANSSGAEPVEHEHTGAAGQPEVATGAKLLEEGARRLRENLQQLRFENRRHRVRPTGPLVDRGDTLVAREASDMASLSTEKLRRFEELRRKIASLEEASWAEEQRLRLEQKEAEERREKQEAFERGLQEQMKRQLQEHREREAREAEEQAQRDEEARQQLEERQSRRKMQLEQEEQRSRQLEEQRLGRFGSHDAQTLADDLERQWAEQEAEERRRVEDYARFRRRQFEEWERHFAAERLRFASEAEFCAAKLRQKARVAAAADEQFYASQRERESWHRSERSPREVEGDAHLAHLAPEERQVLKELRSVLGAPRDAQKAKVKDLLIRLHPDKNPGCTDKAKHLFQFLQEQRRTVLGL